MNRNIRYNNLEQIVKTVKPYRGTEQYPTHGNNYRNGSHRGKMFTIDEIDGEKVFRINYNKSWNKVVVLESMIEELKKTGIKDIQKTLKHEWVNGKYKETDEWEFFYYNVVPCEIGIVRPDDTLEITLEGQFGQGGRYYLEHYVIGYGAVYTDCRRGGMLLSCYKGAQYHYPLYKGIRINLATSIPCNTEGVKVFKNRIDRKEAKKLMANYKDMFNVSKVMLSQMSETVFTETVVDIFTEHGIVIKEKGKPAPTEMKHEEVIALADKLRIEGNHFDSAIMYAYAYDVADISWRMRYYINNDYVFNPKHFMNIDRVISKRIYLDKKPFKVKELVFGEPMPSSEWGYSVSLNGEAVERYRY